MSDRESLLAAILANPDEDTPRLMFADYLDEHGDAARAEFIRVQCALGREFAAEADLPEHFGSTRATSGCDWPMRWWPHDTEERLNLLRRESELLNAHAAAWRAGLPHYADNAHTKRYVLFRRGFVGKVCVAVGPFLKSPAALWAHHPVESLMLAVGAGAARRKLATCQPLAAVRELKFLMGSVTAEVVAPLADCPHLSGVRTIRLDHNEPPDGTMRRLARSPHLKPTTFRAAGHWMNAGGLAAVVTGPFASRLRHLTVDRTGRWAPAVIASAPLTALRKLEMRGIYGSTIDDEGVRLLTLSPHLTQLVTLDVGSNELTNKSLETLAAWPGLASVKALKVGDNEAITARGVVTLLKSPFLAPRYLSVRRTQAGDEGAKAVAKWPGLANVIDLDLSFTRLGEAGLAALADSPHWRDVRHLRVTGNDRLGGPAGRRLRDRLGPNKTDLWG